MKRTLPLLIALATIALLATAFWPKRAPAPAVPALLEPFEFANTLPAIHPPLEALAADVLADPVQRTAARIEWGPPDVMYWTCRHLPADRPRLAALLMARYERIVIGSPLLAQRLIDALGAVQDASAIPFLLRVAELAPPEEEHLQLSAIRALAKFPRDETIVLLFTRLSADPRRSVAAAALQEVVRSEDFGTPQAMNDLLAMYDGGDAIPLLQQVGRRRLVDCADAVLRHLDSPARMVKQNAIFALLAIAHSRGSEEAARMLDNGDESRLVEVLTLFRDAGALLPLERARKLIDHPQGEVRKQLAVALGAGAGTREDAAVDALLTRLAGDADPVVAATACEHLYRRGRTEAVQPWRDRLASGRGAALREAVTFTCEILRDPVAPELVRARLDHEELPGVELGNLLAGLRFYADPTDAPRFVRRILAAGTPADSRAGERTWLSELACAHVQSLGAAVGPALAEAVRVATTPHATLSALDALRGVLKGMAPADQTRCAEQLFAVIRDAKAPLVLRREVIDTIPWFDDAALGEQLFALRKEVEEHALAQRIVHLYASFF
ncbi:MAG: hypothetical protein EXS13_10305 [Planctomycetes bacterium]|nr:hypothetical protein [Planctomycetota bacterium]